MLNIATQAAPDGLVPEPFGKSSFPSRRLVLYLMHILKQILSLTSSTA